MARRRTIDPNIWSDKDVQDLPHGAVLLYIGTISHADDAGRLEWESRQLWARVFPRREDVGLEDVERWMDLLAKKLIHTYTVDGQQYARHPHWKDYQCVNKPAPSRLPAPTDERNDSATDSRGEPVNGSVSPQVPSVSDSVSVSDSDSDSDSDTPNGVCPHKRRKPNLPEPVDLGVLEPDVEIFIANAAAENRTGSISEGRVASIRREFHKLLKELGPDRLGYGLRAANNKGAASAKYVKVAAMSEAGGNAAHQVISGHRRYDPSVGKMTRTGAETAAARIAERTAHEPAESRS